MSAHIKWAVCACVFLLLAIAGHTQDFPVVHFTMAEGLPSNKVYSTFRDSRGYMWVATDKGIARYNGIRFEIFTTFDGLPDNEVFFFQQDYTGRLWMATYNGELCYFKDDTFHTAANTPFLRLPFKSPFIRRISLEADSSISICFWRSTRFINIRHDNITTLNLDPARTVANSGKLLDRQKISDKRYRLYYTDQIIEVDTSGVIRLRSGWPVPAIAAEKPQYWNISFSQNQDYFVSQHYLFDSDGKALMTLDDTFLTNNTLYIVYHNSLSYFFGTSNGIVMNGNMRILRGSQVSCITQNRQGDYWATTLDNGVYVLDKYFMNTRLYKDVYKGRVLFCDGFKGQVFFTGSDNSLYRLEDGRVNVLLNGSRYPADDGKQSAARVFTIDENYRYFYADTRQTVTVDDIRSPAPAVSRVRSDIGMPTALNGAAVAGGSLYLNASTRIVAADIKAGRQAGVMGYTVVNNETNGEKIFGFAKAPDNTIWYSTFGSVYHIVGGRAVLQPQFTGTPLKFFAFYGRSLVGYTHSNKFIICQDYGSTAPRLTVISDQNCIWDKMYLLDSSHLLISTSTMYRVLNLNTLTMSVLENAMVPYQAEAFCSDGSNVYFFRNGAITAIEMSRLLTPPEPPRLHFTYLRSSSRLYHLQRDIEIPFNESRNITAAFSTISSGGKDVQYFYSVSRGEDAWQPLSGDEINLVNPGSGYYTIKVKARTMGSGFSAPIVCNLYVARPFWASWWFITLCIWAAVAGVWGIIRYRLHIVLLKKESLYQTEIKFMKSEYKAMNALMNPHFIFNTLNNVQSLVNANDKVAANEYLRIFADLIRQNMQNIAKELIPLQKEIDLVGNYLSLEKLRFEDKLTYSIDIEDGIDLSEFIIPPLLIQPLVENSIKHGILPLRNKKGIIRLSVYEDDNGLYIEVRDNGVGMSKPSRKDNPLHESFGLENITKRVEQLGAMQNRKITFRIEEIMDKADLQSWTVATIFISF